MSGSLKDLRVANIRRGAVGRSGVIYARLECPDGILVSATLDYIVARIKLMAEEAALTELFEK